MYWHLIPVPFALFVIYLYFLARKRNDLKRVAIVQPLGTALIVGVAALSLLSPAARPGFTRMILLGLYLSLVGDFLNVDMADRKTVMVGLIIFVFAYLVYPVGVTVYNGFQRADIVVALVFLVILAVLLAYLWAGIGAMRIPVIVYALVLSFMVSRAISTFFSDVFSMTQAVLLTAGIGMIFLGISSLPSRPTRGPLPLGSS